MVAPVRAALLLRLGSPTTGAERLTVVAMSCARNLQLCLSRTELPQFALKYHSPVSARSATLRRSKARYCRGIDRGHVLYAGVPMARRHTAALADNDDYASRRLVVVAAFDVVNFSAIVEADEEQRAGGVAGAASRDRSADRRGRRPHLQVPGRRPAGRVHQPGRGDAHGARGPGGGRQDGRPSDDIRLQAALRHPHGRGDRRRHRPAGRRHQHRVAPAGACADRRRAGVGRGHGPDQRPHRRADQGRGRAEAQEHQPARARLYGGRRQAAGDRRRRSTASSGAGPRSPCCRSSTSRRAEARRHSYFSDGLVEDIISALSCLPELVVISRASTLRYRGAAPDPGRSAATSRVRYMLSGSVRRAGDKVRLSAELADCESGTSDLERPLRRRRRRSVRVAGRAVGPGGGDDRAPGAGVRAAPRAAQAAGEPRRLRMRAARARPALPLRGRQVTTQALPLFQRAMALDPNYATAYALAATCYSERFDQGAVARSADRQRRPSGWPGWRSRSTASIRWRCRCAATSAPWLFRDYDHAIELFDRALAANPSSAIAWLRSSATFSYIGETREARRRVDIGLRLSPYDAHVFFSYGRSSLASYAAGDYDDAVLWARKSAALNPRFIGNLRFLAASLAASGQIDEARQAPPDLLRVHPQVQRPALRRGPCPAGIPTSAGCSATISCWRGCRSSGPRGRHFASASLMRCSSMSRIGASAGSSASSVFQRCGARPACRRRRSDGGAEIEQRQRVARLGLLQPLAARRRPRARAARRARAGGHGPRPSRRAGGHRRAQRIGLGIGVGGVGVLAQHLPGVGEAQPAGAILRVLLHPGGQALDHAADRLLALLGRQRCHRLLLLARRLRHGGRCRREFGSRPAALATRAISARSIGRKGASGGLLASSALPARQRGAAVAALRLVQAEIIERARIVGPQRRAPC